MGALKVTIRILKSNLTHYPVIIFMLHLEPNEFIDTLIVGANLVMLMLGLVSV